MFEHLSRPTQYIDHTTRVTVGGNSISNADSDHHPNHNHHHELSENDLLAVKDHHSSHLIHVGDTVCCVEDHIPNDPTKEFELKVGQVFKVLRILQLQNGPEEEAMDQDEEEEDIIVFQGIKLDTEVYLARSAVCFREKGEPLSDLKLDADYLEKYDFVKCFPMEKVTASSHAIADALSALSN